MTLNKLYSRINWRNYPSEESPVNEINLNRIDVALNALDDRVLEQDATKANKTDINNLVTDWIIDEKTGIITISRYDGSQVLFDLNIEKVPIGFALSEDGILTMTTEDGSKFTADIGSMIPVLAFSDSNTIAVSVTGSGTDKTYSFSIKSNSITANMLDPNYLANVQVAAGQAQGAAEEAVLSAAAAKNSEVSAKSSEDSVAADAAFAAESAESAKTSGEAALTAQAAAETAKTAAETAKETAVTKATEADTSARTATEKASVAVDSEAAAQNAAEIAEQNAQTATDKSILAKSYSEGGTGTRAGEDTDNAKYYMEQAKLQTGDIPTKLSQLQNDAGYITVAVDNLINYYKTSQLYTRTEVDSKLSSIPKFGVQVVDELPTENIAATTLYLLKESEEGTNKCSEWVYINGAWESIGSVEVDMSEYLKKDGDGSNLTEIFAQASTVANIASGESHSTIFGRISKAIADYITHKTTTATASALGHVKVDSALSASSTNPVQNKAVKSALDNKLAATGDASNTTAVFAEAATYGNIQSGDKLSGILGKIKKAISHIGNTDISNIGDGTVTGGLFAINSDLGNCAFSTREDGVYITYTLPGGADAVTKKLGSGGTPMAVTLPYTATANAVAVAVCTCLNNANVVTPITSTVAIRDMTTGTNLVTASSMAGGVTYSSIPGVAVVDIVEGHQYALIDVQNPPHVKYGYMYVIE